MPAEHYRPKVGNLQAGYYQGYFCGRCGAAGMSMQGSRRHGRGVCLSNPLMVKKLIEANTVEAETKRQFIRSLKKGKPTEMPDTNWEYTAGGRKK